MRKKTKRRPFCSARRKKKGKIWAALGWELDRILEKNMYQPSIKTEQYFAEAKNVSSSIAKVNQLCFVALLYNQFYFTIVFCKDQYFVIYQLLIWTHYILLYHGMKRLSCCNSQIINQALYDIQDSWCLRSPNLTKGVIKTMQSLDRKFSEESNMFRLKTGLRKALMTTIF